MKLYFLYIYINPFGFSIVIRQLLSYPHVFLSLPKSRCRSWSCWSWSFSSQECFFCWFFPPLMIHLMIGSLCYWRSLWFVFTFYKVGLITILMVVFLVPYGPKRFPSYLSFSIIGQLFGGQMCWIWWFFSWVT